MEFMYWLVKVATSALGQGMPDEEVAAAIAKNSATLYTNFELGDSPSVLGKDMYYDWEETNDND